MRTRALFLRQTCVFLCVLAWFALARADTPPQVAYPAQLDLQHHRGRVVIVDFWASWCKPCRQSIPWLNEMRNRYGERGLTVIGVNVDAERTDAERFLRDVPVDFPVLFDPAGKIAREYQLMGMPTSLVFARDGTLAARHIGFRSRDGAARESDLRKLLFISSEEK